MRYPTRLPSSFSPEFLARVRRECEKAAIDGEPIGYQELAEAVLGDSDRGSPDRRFLRIIDAVLCILMREDVRAGRPFVAVAAQRAGEGVPGAGFFVCAHELGRFSSGDAAEFVASEWSALRESLGADCSGPGVGDCVDPPVQTVVSGGQTGADRGALAAASAAGLTTGGYMPRGYRAEDGEHPEFAERYGLSEHSSSPYPPRTRRNIEIADASIVFASNFRSPGSRLTIRLLQEAGQPHLLIDVHNPPSVAEVQRWLAEHRVATLNVAGNSESRSPGIQRFVAEFLARVFGSDSPNLVEAASSEIDPEEIAFTKVRLPFGWLGNMSPHPIRFEGKLWRSAEALFQALRFEDDAIREEIRSKASPMAAKFAAKKHKRMMVVQPQSERDVENMRRVLRLKLDQHPELRRQLVGTQDRWLIEDCSNRGSKSGLFWGAARRDGNWVGQNSLGFLWMELREELASGEVDPSHQLAA